MAAGNDDCDTKLCLTPGGRPSSSSSNHKRQGMPASEMQQKISIFYGGHVCVCDVTEIQARAILSMARREMEEKMRSRGGHDSASSSLGGLWPECSPPEASPKPQLLNSRLSMKRSLQRFFHKRKNKACQSSSPHLMHDNLCSGDSSSSS